MLVGAGSDSSAGAGLDRRDLAAGSGHLEIVRSAGRSRVTRAVATSPLRLLTPGNEGKAAWVFTSTYGGGLVVGDA